MFEAHFQTFEEPEGGVALSARLSALREELARRKLFPVRALLNRLTILPTRPGSGFGSFLVAGAGVRLGDGEIFSNVKAGITRSPLR